MEKTLDHVVDEAEFERHHKAKQSHRSQKDIFFIWTVVMILSVVVAHAVLNISPGISGFVTAKEDSSANGTILLSAAFALFVTILAVGIIHVGLTKNDY